MLSRTTTLYAVLEEYPFLEDFLVAFDNAFDRLAQPAQGTTWARVVTLAELATAMDLPWLEFLREIQREVRRVTGVAPPIVGEVPELPSDPRLGDDMRAILGELESGAPLDDLAERFDALTHGLNAEEAAALARQLGVIDEVSGQAIARSAGQSDDWPAARLSLHPGHPVRALLGEGARLRGLATHVEEVVDGLGNPVRAERWRQARPALQSLLERLGELDRQARRLRLAWYPTLSNRGGLSVTALVDAELTEALDAVERSRAAAADDVPVFVVGATRRAIEMMRRALVAEEELLAPAAMRGLDDDDWEVVAEQERVVGWALARDEAP